MNISVTKGQSALFKCTVSKEDDVEVEQRWTLNDYPLDPSQSQNLRVHPNGTLQILEAKNTDIGLYKCEARSVSNEQAGNDSRTAYLNVVELPYAPPSAQAELGREKRSVNLTWLAAFDGNSPILKYIVQARVVASLDIPAIKQQQQISFEESDQPLQTNDWYVLKDNIPSFPSHLRLNQPNYHSTLLTDLKPAFTYEFRVSAVNGIGEGMPSRSSNNVTIPEEAPSQSPQNFQASSIGSRWIHLQWAPPILASWNGRLKGYQIAYSLSFLNSTWKTIRIEDPTQTSANLTDLIVWEVYSIKICAFNSRGLGRFSEPALRVRTKEGIPIRPPANFRANPANSTCVRMAWSEPPAQFVNGAIQGYRLTYSAVDQPSQSHIINAAALKRAHLDNDDQFR